MKNSWHVIFVLVLLGSYLGGFGVIRAGCSKVSGPFAGVDVLAGPAWYRHTNAGHFLSEIYWPMFWLENKITGEYLCPELTRRSEE